MTEQMALDYYLGGNTIEAGSKYHEYMRFFAQRAIEITTEINCTYHSEKEIGFLFSKLIGKQVDEGFCLFPPFYTDCGKNISLGKNVFINSGCNFQDQGGINIGEGCLIGHKVVMATINHDLNSKTRANMKLAPINIGKNVWIGSGSIILSGVNIGDGAVIAAGTVVTQNVEANTVFGGIPGREIKKIKEEEYE